MRKWIFFILIGLLPVCKSIGQSVLAQWNFNSLPSDTLPSSGTAIGNIGNTLLSTTGSATNNGYFPGGLTDPETMDNSGYSTSGYPAATVGNKTAGVKFMVSTLYYGAINLSFETKQSTTAANRLVVQYSLNDIDYFDVPGGDFTAVNDLYKLRSLDMSGLSAVSNQPNVYFKIVTAFVGSTYAPTSAGAYNPATGTIRFDMITVTGIGITCSGSATTQASGMILTQTNANSMTLAFKRGNGLGCLVVARQGNPVTATPFDGTSYNANPNFGAGSQLGAGNFVVANVTGTGSQQITITGLTAGQPYYFELYEYSQSGYCYFKPPFTYSAYCNSTILTPGDMLIVGFDATVLNSSDDRYFVTNLVDLKLGTTFQLVNSRFEAGASAGSRTNYWRGGGSDAFEDPTIASFRYIGSNALPKGSIISWTVSNKVENVMVNNVSATALFDAPLYNKNTFGGMMSASEPDQIFLVSGYFTAYGTVSVNRYNLLTGNVLSGITNSQHWVPFNTSVSAGSSSSNRVSRIPPQINCIQVDVGASTNGFGYYKAAALHIGTKAQTIGSYNNVANWQLGSGTGIDEASATNFTINPSNQDGLWNGTANTDWFNCSNWEGLHIPDYTIPVTIPAVANLPEINNSNIAFKAAEYQGIAATDSLIILAGAAVAFKGSANDHLSTYGPITIAATGKLQFETSGAGLDSLYLKNHLTSNGTSNTTGLIPGSGSVLIDQNVDNVITELNSTNSPLFFNNLALATTTGATLTSNTQAAIKGLLRLSTGLLNTGSNSVTLAKTASVISPMNSYGETDNGWIQSFINGKVIRESEAITRLKFPIGKLVGGVPFFAPCAITPANATLKTYNAEYFPTSPMDVFNVANPPLDHVSQLEYWEMDCNTTMNPNKDAYITLYWNPYSQVGPGALADLRIAHYFDDDGTSTFPIRWAIDGSSTSFVTNGNLNYGTITNNAPTTSYSPFTFGSISLNNVLPIQLIQWQATPQLNKVQLSWSVLDDREVASYTIEKSTDGRHFREIHHHQSLQLNSVTNYMAYDAAATAGWNYYRLIHTNLQGKSFTYKTQKVWMGSTKQLQVYPNPATTSINIVIPDANATISLIDLSGKKVWTTKTSQQKNSTISVQHLPRGIYLLQYQTPMGNSSQKVVLH